MSDHYIIKLPELFEWKRFNIKFEYETSGWRPELVVAHVGTAVKALPKVRP